MASRSENDLSSWWVFHIYVYTRLHIIYVYLQFSKNRINTAHSLVIEHTLW